MTDDFVKKAFSEATAAAKDREFDAYRKRIVDMIEPISIACGIAVGLDEMEKLSSAVIKAGVQEALADWTRMVMTIAFSEGYKAKAEEVD